MKKALFFLTFCLIAALLVSIPALAKKLEVILPLSKTGKTVHDPEGLPGEGFYASAEEQKAVIEGFLNCPAELAGDVLESGYLPLEESVFYFYDLDLLHYNATGELKLFYQSPEERWYTAKAVFASDGIYAGDARFTPDSGTDNHYLETYYPSYTPNGAFYNPHLFCSTEYLIRQCGEGNYEETGSKKTWDYASAADWIRRVVGADSIIPEKYVRMVQLYPSTEQGWYINDGVREGVVWAGRFLSLEDLKTCAALVASEYNRQLSQNGSVGLISFPYSGSDLALPLDPINVLNTKDYLNGADAVTSVTDDNRNSIFSYLPDPLHPALPSAGERWSSADPVVIPRATRKKTDEAEPEPDVSASASPWQAWIGAGAAATLAIAAGIVLRRKQKEE